MRVQAAPVTLVLIGLHEQRERDHSEHLHLQRVNLCKGRVRHVGELGQVDEGANTVGHFARRVLRNAWTRLVAADVHLCVGDAPHTCVVGIVVVYVVEKFAGQLQARARWGAGTYYEGR